MKKIFFGLIVILCLSATNGYSQAATPNQVSAPGSQAKISFKEADNKHEFGTVPQGTPVSYVFNFTNTGKEPLVLTTVNASCGCTTPEWPREPIQAGKTGSIKVTYNAANSGPFTKTITIVSNASNPQTILTIQGEVKPAQQASPAQTAAAPSKKN